jgi:uncharacterized membrane protein
MNTLPPIPSWDGLHPLVVHFPIALLISAPLLVVLGLLFRKDGRGLHLAALLLMVLGTVAAFVAVETGEAAAELADRTPEVMTVIQTHQRLAETTRYIFAGLTAAYALLLFLPRLLKRDLSRRAGLVMNLVFLAAYSGGVLFLVNTAHNGGRLVHEMGVHALM